MSRTPAPTTERAYDVSVFTVRVLPSGLAVVEFMGLELDRCETESIAVERANERAEARAAKLVAA